MNFNERIIKSENRTLEKMGYADIQYVSTHPENLGLFGGFLKIKEKILKPGEAFLPQTNDKLDIVKIPLQGMVQHINSRREDVIIDTENIQVMRCGIGVSHYEYNKSGIWPYSCLEIEFKNSCSTASRTKLLKLNKSRNSLRLVDSFYSKSYDENYFQYSINYGLLDTCNLVEYQTRLKNEFAIIFVVKGGLLVSKNILRPHDTYIFNAKEGRTIEALKKSEFVIIEFTLPEKYKSKIF